MPETSRVGALAVLLLALGPGLWSCSGDPGGEEGFSSDRIPSSFSDSLGSGAEDATVPSTSRDAGSSEQGSDATTPTGPSDSGPHSAEPSPPGPVSESGSPPSGTTTDAQALVWTAPIDGWPAALLSVSGTSDDDVWIVGAAVEDRATVLHWDGTEWTSVDSGFDGDLWWVQAVDERTVFAGGESGAVLRFRDGRAERLDSPGLGRHTVFGVHATGPDQVWAVGGIGNRGGFLWRWTAGTWEQFPLPLDAPTLPHGDTAAIFKAWGGSDGALTLVGGGGGVFRVDAEGSIAFRGSISEETLFTVAGSPDGEILAVGGAFEGVIVTVNDEGLQAETTDSVSLLQGVAFGPDGQAWASGTLGTLLRREAGAWQAVPHGLDVQPESLHAIWVSPGGQVWAVGGNVLSAALDEGVLVHGAPADGPALPRVDPPAPSPPPDTCPEHILQAGAEGSIARRWNEQTLHAIRRALPEPTVHARNLYHLSVALHDAWAAYSADFSGLVHEEAATVGGTRAREETMSHAAFRLLVHRYGGRLRGDEIVLCLRAVMEDLGLDPDNTDATSDTPAALGNRIGQAVIANFRQDGALERLDYNDPGYRFSNPPLYVDDPGIQVDDPSTWQPLDISRAVTQNGIPEPAGPQVYIGPHWGGVTPFAIRRPDFGVPYFPLGERPTVDTPDIAAQVIDVLRRTSWLDIDDGVTVDISPGAYGNNPLATDDGEGHPINPFTEAPYESQVVLRGDFGRVLAEYWADGPDSETPPGHWNSLAHAAFDHPAFERRFYGEGPIVDRLTWDVWALLLLNGALHDAAIVAWEAKRLYETARPSTLIRWKGANGQRSDPGAPAFHPDGLPLVDGLIEVITEASSAPGERHAHLRRHIGEIAVWTWPGEPANEHTQRSPLRWIRAVEWMPYQPRTFVNPAFPGYVSGHSTFSHAAAELLSTLTGSPYFPGGLAEFVAERDAYLEFEQGPSQEVRLQWATYRDAADQAGQSRIWGGIHIVADDHDGRQLGNQVGAAAADWGRNRVIGIQPLPNIGDPANPIHGGQPDDPDDSTIGGPPTGDPDLVIGTGRNRWTPLTQRQTLRWERGHQGGFHLWVSVFAADELMEPLSPEERSALETRFTVHDAQGELLASATRIGGFRETQGQWELTGTFAILRGNTHPADLAGLPLELEVVTRLPNDDVRRSAVTVTSACCD